MFYTSHYKFYIKYKAIRNHWVGHSLIKPIDVDDLFNKRIIIRELESSLNDDGAIYTSIVEDDKIEASVVVYLVQEDASVNTEIKKRGKIASSYHNEDHLEEQDNNKTQEHVAT